MNLELPDEEAAALAICTRPHRLPTKSVPSMLDPAVRQKIEDLIRRSSEIAPPGSRLQNKEHTAACERWITEALNIIDRAVPVEDNAYNRAIARLGGGGMFLDRVVRMGEILKALLVDSDAGLIADFGNKIRAETFDDFLNHADEYRQEGQHKAAGVLAGVVFEDTIRRICRGKGIADKDQNLEQLINALARRTVITGLQSKQAKAAADVRAKATHALWDEYNLDDVAEVIRLTRRLLEDHLDR
jgi:hypothetical protein